MIVHLFAGTGTIVCQRFLKRFPASLWITPNKNMLPIGLSTRFDFLLKREGMYAGWRESTRAMNAQKWVANGVIRLHACSIS